MKTGVKKQNIHILGIAGTFMGGIAQLAKAMGHNVSGSDKAIYPPMSTQLEQAGIAVSDDQNTDFLKAEPDAVVIGNALSRGHTSVEATLNSQQFYISGPQWLADHILKDRWVIAVAGTHGKTSTASMVAWILEFAKLNPGFLIGGVPANFGVSARLGDSPFFVVEADEYDTAFFDKRSKFVHYRPRTCVLNNLEFDHADIFDSIDDIQRQFHHLVRTVPSNGLIVMPTDEPYLDQVIEKGCWTPVEKQGTAGEWSYSLYEQDGSEFEVRFQGNCLGRVSWSLTGLHNVRNALSAIAAAVHCGVPARIAVEGLCSFSGILRRMDLMGETHQGAQQGTKQGIKIYDDFAHHPTAIATTLKGARNQLLKNSRGAGFDSDSNNSESGVESGVKSRAGRLIAVFEPRSNTMRMGVHAQTLPSSFDEADVVYAFIDQAWNWNLPLDEFKAPVTIEHSYEALLATLIKELQPNDTVVIMSNGSFGGIHQKLFNELDR